MFSQTILFPESDLTVVWPQFLALVTIGAAFFELQL